MALLSVIVLFLIRVPIPVFRKKGFSVFTPSGDLEDGVNLHEMLGRFSRLPFPKLGLMCSEAVRPAVAVESPSLCFKRSESSKCTVFIGIKAFLVDTGCTGIGGDFSSAFSFFSAILFFTATISLSPSCVLNRQ